MQVLTGLPVYKITAIAMCVLLACNMPVFAQNWCEGMITDKVSRVVPRMSKPAALQTYTDPSFGTQITRVTNAPSGTAHRTLYNTIQPWNADESLLILYHTGDENAGHHLYDGRTYRYIRQLEFAASDIEGIYWDEVDSSRLYFIQRRPRNDALFGKLVSYDVNTRTRSLVADLDSVCGSPANRNGKTVRGGNDIQGLAGNLIGLRCVNNEVEGNTADITFHVNVRTGKIGPRLTIDPTRPLGSNDFGMRPDVSVSTLHSGRRVLLQDSVFDVDMNFLYRIDSSLDRYRAASGVNYSVPKLEHSTIGRMPNGNDAIFSPRFNAQDFGCENDSDFGRGALVAHDLQSDSCRVMVGRSTGWGYPLNGVHLSSVSSQNPGWVAMTSIGYGQLQYLDNGQSAPLLFSELSLTHADPDNPTTCRLAHTRTMAKSASRGDSYRGGYFGEPHPVMSPSGSRILFNSDWHDSGSVDTYSVHLQSDARDPVFPVPEEPDTEETVAEDVATANSDSSYSLKAQVRMQETPARVYVDFSDDNPSSISRVSIARAGSPDSQLVMWLYTNGTHNGSLPGPRTGRLGFLQSYIGTGRFEARFYANGNADRAIHRTSFSIPDSGTNTDPTEDSNAPVYGLQAQVRLQESPSRVYVDFADTRRGADTVVKIAVADSPDNQHKMWLYTNGTQRLSGQGLQTGRLGFLQQYLGRGRFEARLFVNGNLNQAVRRIAFSIP